MYLKRYSKCFFLNMHREFSILVNLYNSPGRRAEGDVTEN